MKLSLDEIEPFTAFEIKTLCIARKLHSEEEYNQPIWSSAAIQPLIDRLEKLEKALRFYTKPISNHDWLGMQGVKPEDIAIAALAEEKE